MKSRRQVPKRWRRRRPARATIEAIFRRRAARRASSLGTSEPPPCQSSVDGYDKTYDEHGGHLRTRCGTLSRACAVTAIQEDPYAGWGTHPTEAPHDEAATYLIGQPNEVPVGVVPGDRGAARARVALRAGAPGGPCSASATGSSCTSLGGTPRAGGVGGTSEFGRQLRRIVATTGRHVRLEARRQRLLAIGRSGVGGQCDGGEAGKAAAPPPGRLEPRLRLSDD